MHTEIDESWKSVLTDTFESPYFDNLISKVEEAYVTEDVWPKKDDLFAAFNRCKFNDLKVVILGQDPYPTPGHAHGLCFSVPSAVKPLAKSLQNIFKEIESDLGSPRPVNGNLDHWAQQGVFLLNTVLSVNAFQPNSHKNFGWEIFTDYVIETISQKHEGIIFLLWGAQAQRKDQLIDETLHHILRAPHPSPLSAYRGFFGCKHFSKTNALLISQGKPKIIW